MTVEIRFANPEDAETLHRFVTELAAFEKDPDAVTARPGDYRNQLAMNPPPFEALIAERNGEPVGFALFFHNYSTWAGRPGLYVEDFYVSEAHRGRGIGRMLAARLAHIATGRGCARMEWSVLTWNEDAIAFYEKLGGRPLGEWTTYRLHGHDLVELARKVRDGESS